MLRSWIVLIMIPCCLISICHAEELDINTFIQMANQARFTVQSGEVTMVTTVEYAPQKSEDEITAWIQTEREQELKHFFPHDFSPKISVKTFEKEYLIPSLEFEANQYRHRREIVKSTTAFQVLRTDEIGSQIARRYKQTHQEMLGISIESENAKHFRDSNFSLLVYDGQKQMKEDIGDITSPVFNDTNSHQFWDSDYHAGYILFELFGRAPYPIPANAKYVGKEQIDSTDCHVLTYEANNGIHSKIWVDMSLDFCIRKKEISRKTQKSTYQISDTLYQKFEKFEDIWYPKIRNTTIYGKDGLVTTRALVEIVSAKFNVNFPENFFEVNKNFYDKQQGELQNEENVPAFGDSSATRITEADETFLLCGPLSLFRVCELLKIQTDLDELKKLSGFSPNRGTTMLGIKDAAIYKGLAPVGVRVPMELLRRKKALMPAIAYINFNHFIVFESIDEKGVTILDPAQKYEPHLTWDKLADIWYGDLLIFNKKKTRRTNQDQVPLAFASAPEYNFGKALGGSKIKHNFIIKNIGQKPLEIASVTETCACTASITSQDEILPGRTSSISTVLTLPSESRQIHERIFVLTNDPIQNTLTLTLKGETFLPLTTFPTRLYLGSQKPLQTSLTKQISLHLEKDVQLLGIRTDSKHMKATLATDIDIPTASLQILSSLPIGNFSQSLLIDYTYKGKKATHDVLVFGEILGDLKVVPNRLFFGLIKDPASISKIITISSRNTNPFQITSAASNTNAIVVTLAKEDKKTYYQLTATISPKTEAGELSGEVVVHTSSSIQPIIRVPFFGIIADNK